MAARVILTGASSGIGAAATAALRERGAQVVGLDLVPGDGVLACDVRDQVPVDAAVAEAIGRLGGVDVLINNAGIGDAADTGQAPSERSLAILDVNLVGPWRVTSAALPALLESRGRVVNVASGLAHLAIPFSAAYCMSKRGLTAFSDVLRLEYGSRLTVTTVYPGYIRTPIHDAPAEQGVSLEGLVPEEPLRAAAATLVRAALGRPARDLATTRAATLNYTLLRLAPRRLVDRIVAGHLRRRIRDGALRESVLAHGYRERLNG